MDIQSQIDDLFAPQPEEAEEPQQSFVEEQTKKPEYERVVLSDNLFEGVSIDELNALFEVAAEVQEEADITQEVADAPLFLKDVPPPPAPVIRESYEELLMKKVASQITSNAKSDNTIKEVTSLNEEERFRNLETQLIQVRQLFHEATMVSGIGQGGDGQTPGSGEVKLSRMDDVSTEGLEVGDTLVWGGVNGWVPGTSGIDASDVVSSILPGVGIDVAGTIPPGKGDVTIALDASIGDLNDVNVDSASEGQALVYQAGGWVAAGVTTNQVDLTNPSGNPYNISYPRYNQITPTNVYTTQEDANQLFGALIDDLDDRVGVIENATKPGTYLGQEDVTDPANEPDTSALNQGDYFIHDGATGALWGVGDQVENGDSVIWNGATWEIISTTTTLSQLGDVVISGATTGQMLVYNDTNSRWYNETVEIPKVFIDTATPAGQGEKDGDFWLKSDTNILHIYNTIWTVVGGGAGSTIGPNPPADPLAGALWIDTDDYNLYTWDGEQWIDLTGGAGGDAAYVTLGDLNDTLDTVQFNITEVQNNLNVAVLALDQTHLRITPQAQLLGPLLLSDDDITADKQAVTKEYVTDTFLPLSGGQLTGALYFRRGNKTSDQFKISPNSSDTDYATNIYGLNNGQVRLRTSHTNIEGDHVGSHIVMDPKDGSPETKIYHVVTPTSGKMAANKDYVDTQVGAGVPVGSIMIWMNSSPPPGWLKLQGGDFDINTYPELHAYLQNTGSYTTGKLPNWGGYFPGEWGGSNGTGSLGTKQGYKTAEPTGGNLKSSSGSVPTGATRGFSPAGSTNAYSDGQGRLSIRSDEWDDVTRPNTILVHYIIKHD